MDHGGYMQIMTVTCSGVGAKDTCVSKKKKPPARQIVGRRGLLSPDLAPPTIPCWLSEDAKCHQGATQPGDTHAT